ncbi:MAG TPA: CtsR family transcriptional regulator [Papillibacter sp.]|jgi:transcriptional regulator CtsR|nr:CtsR family transcriptional regulator [Papillibacter sp.]
MGMSDLIAHFILKEIQAADDGSAELQRSELANRFNCVPSQINYVIATRFSPEHGYIVESRRGGGGFIRITRVKMEPTPLIMHTVNSIGDEIDVNSAAALIKNLLHSGAITEKECRMMLAAVGQNALRPAAPEQRDAIRASILKQVLLRLRKI